jgi:PPOX class probable F420-dependent enzyme
MALDSKLKQFLDENPYVGAATTLRQDGSPHTTVVWVDTEGGKVSFNTARGRAKERHIARDGRVSLIVVDPNDPYKWVSVSGRAELTEEGAEPQIDKLAKKYIGHDTYPWRDPQQTRVKVLIEPEKVDSAGFDS